MIEDVFASVFAIVLGLALAAWIAALARNAARHQRELARRKGEISSQQQLEDLIRAISQAETDEGLDRLEDGKDHG